MSTRREAGGSLFFSYFKITEKTARIWLTVTTAEMEALNDDKSFLTPELSKDKLMRDPCIIEGPDGKFHMVWTVSWEEKGIGYANSADLSIGLSRSLFQSCSMRNQLKTHGLQTILR